MKTSAPASLSAKPGSHIFDYESKRFVGKLNNDGTENRAWVSNGDYSFLNTLLDASGGYIPKDPQAFAEGILGVKGNGYTVRGYSIAVSCYTLQATEWVPLLEGASSQPIVEILQHLQKADESKAKYQALCSLLRRELTRRDLSALSEVTEADRLLLEGQKQVQKESSLTLGFKRLASLNASAKWTLMNEQASDEKIAGWATKVTTTDPSAYMGFVNLYEKAERTQILNARKALIDWARDNQPLHQYLAEQWEPPFSDILPTLSTLIALQYPYQAPGFYGQHAGSAAREAIKDRVFLKNYIWATYQLDKTCDSVKEDLRAYLGLINGFQYLKGCSTLDEIISHIRFRKRGKGVVLDQDGVPCSVVRRMTWEEFRDQFKAALSPQTLELYCPYNRR